MARAKTPPRPTSAGRVFSSPLVRAVLGILRRTYILSPVGLIVLSIVIAVALTMNRAPLATYEEASQQIQAPAADGSQPAQALAADGSQRVQVLAMEVQPQTLTLRLRSYGNVMPHRQTELSTEVSGSVVEVLPQFLVGGFFEKGDILMRIDERDYRAELKQAKASVASARSRLALEQGLADGALRDWRMLRPELSPEKANPLTLRKPQLEEAKGGLESALAMLQKAESNLMRTVVRAPYNGLVRARYVDVGQYVSVGENLGLIYSTDYAEIRLPLPEQQLGYIDLPNRHTTTYPLVSLSAVVGDSEHYWYARIVRTENVVDEHSRHLFVVASVADPYGISTRDDINPDYVPLRYGTFVRGTIDGRTIDNLVVLPRSLLYTENTVWVIEGTRLVSRTVSVLQTDGDEIYVHEGLNPGEVVNLSPLGYVLPGTEVLIKERVAPDHFIVATAHQARHENTISEASKAASDVTGFADHANRGDTNRVEMERLPQ